MNIAIIIPSLKRKGPNFVAFDLISGLIQTYGDENSIDLYYFEDSHVSEESISFPIPAIKISFFTKINFGKYDIIHSHMLKPDLYLFFNKIFFSIKRRNKIISTIHQIDYINLKYDYKNKTKAFIYSFIWRAGLSLHDHIVCLSSSMRDYYKCRLINKNISYIYNGRDFHKGNISNNKISTISINKASDNEIVIGTACLLTERKGLEQVIKVLDKFPSFRFVIAGDGPEMRKLSFLAESYGVLDRVTFCGLVQNTQHFYNMLDFFILPSRGEGFPLALIEAMSSSLPCICSNLDVICEVFCDDEVSIFKLDDLDSLVTAINYAINNKNKLITNSRCRYLKDFTSTTMAKKYMSLYQEVSQ